MSHWKRLATVAATLVLLACSESDDPVDPGDGPRPGPGEGPYLSEAVLIDTGTDFLNDVPPDWSPDGCRIVFSGKTASSVWTTTLDTTVAPVRITDPAATSWGEGAYTPGFLGDGRIVYYMGWAEHGHTMRVMVADTSQIEGRPAPTLLRSFSGSDIGLSDDQASSPRRLTLSDDGLRAAGLWRALYLLDWTESGQEPPPISRSPDALAGASSPCLSRDGLRIAFVDAEERVAWMGFDDDTPQVVGAGAYPSWSGDGQALGYVAADGASYRVLNLTTGTTISYWASGTELRHARLSWEGDAVAFLNGDETHLRLGWARLVPNED